MTDNTQELREQLTELLTSINRYYHTEPDDRLVDFITAYTNKQIEAVLDKLESNMRGKTVVDTADGWKEFIRKHVNGAIEAERNKLTIDKPNN